MTTITITLDGVPVAKGRPRFGTGRCFTPQKTAHYESYGRLAAGLAMAGRAPLEGALHASVKVCLPVPASWSKKKTDSALSGNIRPVSRPDIDNYLKLCFDAFNEIVFKDDSQIVSVSAEKVYSDKPGLVVEVTPL